jgi:hypothetical protein
MKRMNFLIGMVGISLALGMMVIGCDEDSDDGGGGSASSVTDAQVYQNDESTLYTGSGIVGVVKTGELTIGSFTNGKLSFELPATVPSQYLESLSVNVPAGLTVSNSNASMFQHSIALYSQDERIGSFFLVKTAGNTKHEISYWYFNQAVRITGTSDGATVSIDARAGWNKIYTYETQTSGAMTTNLNNVPSDMKWVVD